MGIIAKIIITIVLLAIVVYFILNAYYDFSNKKLSDPWLIETTRSMFGNAGSVPSRKIRRSNDSKYGVEFTYAFWMYVNTWPLNDPDQHHVFHKGENSSNPLLQAPGVWLKKGNNEMIINMNTLTNTRRDMNTLTNTRGDDANDKEQIIIKNLPVKKWVHITIMLINQNLDVFVNGRLVQRHVLKSPPKQNYGNLYLTQTTQIGEGISQGINGYLSRMRYFNEAIPFWRIEQLINDGPSKAPCPSTGGMSPQLSSSWYRDNRDNRDNRLP